MVYNETQECWHCGDTTHATSEHKPRLHRHAYISQLRPSNPSELAKTWGASLSGAQLGRKAGWRTAQSKSAELVLKMCGNAEEGLAIYKAIMSLEDK